MGFQTRKGLAHKGLLLLGAMVVVAAGIYFWAEHYTTSYDESKIASISCLEYPAGHNFAQYGTTCGPFSAAGAVRAITQEEVDSHEFAESITWKIGDLGTAPPGVKQQLREHDVAVEVPKVRGYTDEERIAFLQERLSQGSAIILLGELEDVDYQHYITLLGFDREKDEFYLYDSFYQRINETHTMDSNGGLPGNRNFSSEELMAFWERGGVWEFYEWFAIVGSEKE